MSLRELTFYPRVLVTLVLQGTGNFPGLLLELLSPGETCFLDNRTSGFPFSWFTSLALSLPEKDYIGHKVVGYLNDWIGLLSSNWLFGWLRTQLFLSQEASTGKWGASPLGPLAWSVRPGSLPFLLAPLTWDIACPSHMLCLSARYFACPTSWDFSLHFPLFFWNSCYSETIPQFLFCSYCKFVKICLTTTSTLTLNHLKSDFKDLFVLCIWVFYLLVYLHVRRGHQISL